MRYVVDIRKDLNRAPDALATKRFLLELAEAVLFRLNAQSELGPWETEHLAAAISHLRANISNPKSYFSTSWLSAAEACIVKSLIPPGVAEKTDGSGRQGYRQLMDEVLRLREMLDGNDLPLKGAVR